jgi:hypothetical protein
MSTRLGARLKRMKMKTFMLHRLLYDFQFHPSMIPSVSGFLWVWRQERTEEGAALPYG